MSRALTDVFGAVQRGDVREAAKDALCRRLWEFLPCGWGIGANAEWQQVHARAVWVSDIETFGGLPHFVAQARAVSQFLCTLGPPHGWKPVGVEDVLITKAFDKAWSVLFKN